MEKLSQTRAPIYEALEAFRKQRVVPFDVPGHKRGRGNPELAELLGEKCVGMDVNSMKPLDNLCHPISVIREAEELAAEAFGAAHAFLMVGGTTSAVQSMVLSTVKRGEKIILPRNVHRSVMGAMVLCGAIPVYVNPECDDRLGIPLGMSVKAVEKAILENPDAKAVLVNNPTYYGICSDLRSIVALAHAHGMLCLADEAHGTHFYFGDHLPASAMACGADMAAVSMHKSGGSLTQSSLLLTGPEPLSFTTLTVSPTEVSFKVFIFSPSFLSNQDFGCHIFSNGHPGIFHIHDEIAVDFRYDCHVSANDEAKIFKKSSGLFFSADFSDCVTFAWICHR